MESQAAMRPMLRIIKTCLRLTSLLLLVSALPATIAKAQDKAQDKAAVQVTSAVSYEYLDRWDVDRLNKILQVDTPKFAGITVAYAPARHAVRLYRITYA